ncbi:hypothetical protein HU200_045718 [Digitaria exilis]|uniref:Uncharacterized protein n=1 Tax=Digitaria exilis TaxID=1010633 RepID=A0A835EA22_9POAL|nr:hypothetical protein HU200_045718 [Digitaria exilis]
MTSWCSTRTNGVDSDDEDEEFDMFPIKQSHKAGATPRTELGELEYDDEEEDDDEVVVFHPDDDEEEEEEEEAFEDDDYEEEGAEEGTGRRRGVPAVMRCFDTAKIFAKAGDGGNGVVAFRREKFVPYGGPSGGDGGRGGDVYVEVDGEMNSLLPFRKSVHFRAGRGAHGMGQQQAGQRARTSSSRCRRGPWCGRRTVGHELLELMKPGQRALLLPGGRGGRGNAAFKSRHKQGAQDRREGEKGPEIFSGLVNVVYFGCRSAPNAGKSTLLSVITAAKPTIANYPFTTLLPNLGVVSLDFDATMVVADLPGLLEGAHRGYGLGYEFLRHSERCSVLVHVVDGSAQQPEYEFEAVRLELELFSPALVDKPYVVVYNKMDLPEASERWNTFREKLQSQGIEPYCISAINRQGTQDVIHAAYKLLQKERQRIKETEEWSGQENLNHVSDAIKKEKACSHELNLRFFMIKVLRSEKVQHALEAMWVSNRTLHQRASQRGEHAVIIARWKWFGNDEPKSNRPIKTMNTKDDAVRWPEFG